MTFFRMGPKLPKPPEPPKEFDCKPIFENREAFYVRCGQCNHKWVAFYTPASIEKCSNILKNIVCPMCFSTSDFIFKDAEENNKAIKKSKGE